MKKFQWPLIFIVLGIALVVLKISFFPVNSQGQGNSPKTSKPNPPKVSFLVSKAQRLDNTILSSGSLKANEEVEIQPEVSGKIVQIFFKEGAKVQQGQLLFRLNDLDLRATLKKLQYNLQLAKENEARQSKLLAINAISQQDYDISKNTVDATLSDIEFTKASIEKTYIKAPFQGIIGLRAISVGSIVNPSSKIASIQQIIPLKLDFSIPEQYASSIKVGDEVHFSLQGNKEKYLAKIAAIEPKIDINTRTLSLRALYANQSSKTLFPGSFAEISLTLHTNTDALLVPTESLIPILKGQTLFIYHNGKVDQVTVETGVRTDTQVEIVQGIKPGDTIITTGLLSLKPQQEVLLN